MELIFRLFDLADKLQRIFLLSLMNLICSRRKFCPRFTLWFWKFSFQRPSRTFVDRIVLVYSFIRSLLQRALKSTKLELACRNGDLGSFVKSSSGCHKNSRCLARPWFPANHDLNVAI
jgi:hypothetical protein